MSYKVGCVYDSYTKFEISVDVNGNGFLIIYGRHINGYFIAIPNFNVCCEAAEPNDTFYNTEKLLIAASRLKEGFEKRAINAAAEDIAFVIRDYSSFLKKKGVQ